MKKHATSQPPTSSRCGSHQNDIQERNIKCRVTEKATEKREFGSSSESRRSVFTYTERSMIEILMKSLCQFRQHCNLFIKLNKAFSPPLSPEAFPMILIFKSLQIRKPKKRKKDQIPPAWRHYLQSLFGIQIRALLSLIVCLRGVNFLIEKQTL